MRHSIVICDECKEEFRNADLNEVSVTINPGYSLTKFDLCTPCLTKLFSRVAVTPRSLQ